MGDLNPIKRVNLYISLNNASILSIENINIKATKFKQINSIVNDLWNNEVIFNDDKDLVVNKKQIGITIEDGPKIIGIREKDIFFLKINEYDNWEIFKHEAIQTLFNILANLEIKPTDIEAIYLQFVYEFIIEGIVRLDIEDYFNFYPQTNTLGESSVTHSDTSVNLYNEATKVFTHLKHRFDQEKNEKFKFTLDIQSGIKVDANSQYDHLIPCADILHTYIKELFINCINEIYLKKLKINEASL